MAQNAVIRVEGTDYEQVRIVPTCMSFKGADWNYIRREYYCFGEMQKEFNFWISQAGCESGPTEKQLEIFFLARGITVDLNDILPAINELEKRFIPRIPDNI